MTSGSADRCGACSDARSPLRRLHSERPMSRFSYPLKVSAVSCSTRRATSEGEVGAGQEVRSRHSAKGHRLRPSILAPDPMILEYTAPLNGRGAEVHGTVVTSVAMSEPQPGLDFATLKLLYGRCRPDEALAPGDERLVDLDRDPPDGSSPPRGERWSEILRREVKLAEDKPLCLLFSGLRGSGKSTELLRLVDRLTEDDYLMVLLDVDERIDLNTPLNLTDLMLLMLYESERAVLRAEDDDQEKATRVGAFARMWNWVTTTDVNLKTELGADFEAPLVPGLKAKIVGELKTKTLLRDRVRAVVESRPTAFLGEIREAFDDLRKRTDALGRQGLVAVVDSLEHLQGTSTNWKEVIDSAEQLFNSSMIQLPVHTLYTVPPSVVLRLKRDVTFIPMVKLRTRDGGTEYAPGHAAMRELVEKRIGRDRLVALFGSEHCDASVRELVTVSGGYPRALVSQLLDVLVQAREGVVPAVSQQEFKRILTRAGSKLRQLVNSDGDVAIALLKRVADTKTLTTSSDDERWIASRLLDSNVLLRYLNDADWWDVHPWVRDMDGVVASPARRA